VGFRKADESGFMATVTRLARLYGWKVFHILDARKSEADFPDLILWRRGDFTVRLIVIELKTETGNVTDGQEDCISAFQWHMGNVLASVKRPSDWPEIERMIKDRS
jgi:hypothetical protein